MALAIVLEAAAAGRLAPGGLLSEGTAGSTGVSLALVAAALGYRCFIAMPDDVAAEKAETLRARLCYFFSSHCPLPPFAAAAGRSPLLLFHECTLMRRQPSPHPQPTTLNPRAARVCRRWAPRCSACARCRSPIRTTL